MASLKDIYKKSSLVMHPAAMKDGKLYSQAPHSGDGDFTFSRADGVQTRVNKHGLIETVADNTPRLSYDVIDGEVADCPHLLLEPSRTNLATDSNLSLLSGGSSGSITTTGDAASADVTLSNGLTGKRLTVDSSGRAYLNISCAVVSGTEYTISIYAENYSGADQSNFIDILSGGGNEDFSSSLIENGRIQGTFTASSTSVSIRIGHGTTSTRTSSYSVDISGVQLEEGSYPTSFIPTSGSTETREAEDSVASLNMTTELTSLSEGTLFGELQFFDTDTADNKNWISIDNGTDVSDDRVMVYLIAGSSIMYGQVKSNSGANVSTLAGRTISDYENVKFAIAFKNNYIKFYINGVEEGSSSSYTLNASAFTNVRIGYSGQNEMKLKQLVVFNEALTEAELQTLTS